MALLWYDGFDTYDSNTTDIFKGKILPADRTAFGTVTTDSGSGRHGFGKYLVCDALHEGMQTPGIDNKAAIILGFAVYISDLPGITSAVDWIYFVNGPDKQCLIKITSSGTLDFYNNTTLLKSSTTSLDLQRWNFVEIKLTIHDSSGAIEIRKDGVTIMTGSSLDTRYSTVALRTGITNVIFTAEAGGGYQHKFWLDDMYLCDTAGGIHDDFLGDCMSYVCPCVADVGTPDFTPSGAPCDNYTMVDDPSNIHDDDTTYNASQTDADEDIFDVDDLPANTTEVIAVKVETWAKLENAGDCTISNILVSDDTTDYAATDLGIQTVYYPLCTIWETDPDTAAAWTVAKADAINVGYRLNVPAEA